MMAANYDIDRGGSLTHSGFAKLQSSGYPWTDKNISTSPRTAFRGPGSLDRMPKYKVECKSSFENFALLS